MRRRTVGSATRRRQKQHMKKNKNKRQSYREIDKVRKPMSQGP